MEFVSCERRWRSCSRALMSCCASVVDIVGSLGLREGYGSERC